MAIDVTDPQTLMRLAAFERVRQLGERHDHLTADELGQGFVFQGERYPLFNPRRGIFKPREMSHLLSIRTVFPKSGNRVWYDDQRDVHRQVFEGDEAVDYAFMGENPDAADNRWLRQAHEDRVPLIYFLGIAPGRYEAIIPAFVLDWNRSFPQGKDRVRRAGRGRVGPTGRCARAALRASDGEAAATSSDVPGGGRHCLSWPLRAFRVA